MVRIYSQKEIVQIGASGKILAKILSAIEKRAEEGISLNELDNLAFKLVKSEGGKPAFFGYRPGGASNRYMAAICTSINETVVHGFPNKYRLRSGDILKVDFGVEYNGFFSDSAFTVGIGKISKDAQKLISGTKEALSSGIKSIRPDATLGDLGSAIKKVSQKHGLTVIKELTGHGVGRELHEDPVIYNFGRPHEGMKLKPGMVLAIEPMFSLGGWQIYQRDDESWALEDQSLSAHFEHTVAITEKGSKILTK